MSQFLAIVAPEDESVATSRDSVAAALAEWPGRVDVVTVPGAVLGISLAPVDSWRARDRQPQVSEAAAIAVVADCRLDDREALRSSLDAAPDAIDGQLLLSAAARWGPEIVSHLKGDFAGVVWDGTQRRVVAFRDPLGVKPLFYGHFGRRLVIASDVDLMVKCIRPRVAVNDRLVVQHLLWHYTSVDETFWTGIRRLPAGHRLVGTADRPTVERYWFPATAGQRWSNAPQMERAFAECFRQSVARRLDSDRPTFAHLSGGLDSSSIVCVGDDIRRSGNGGVRSELRALSERFPGMSCDESPFIDAVLNHTGIHGISWIDPMTSLPDLEQPSLAGPGTRTYRTTGGTNDLDLVVEGGGSVLLSGQGGDQLGSAVEVIDDMIHAHPVEFALQTVGRRDLTIAQRRLRARLLVRTMLPLSLRRRWGMRRHRRRLPAWLQHRGQALADELGEALYRESDLPLPDAIRRARWRDLNSATLGSTLDLDYRAAASKGVEFRYPFLDQDLVSLVLSVPSELWPRPSGNARLQRAALSSVLPPSLVNRRVKALFGEPVARRLKNVRQVLHRLLYAGEWLSEGFVDRTIAQSLYEQVVVKEGVESSWSAIRSLWGIATLEAWLRVVFGYAPARSESR